MPDKVIQLDALRGLSEPEVLQLREKHGLNSFRSAPSRRFLHMVKDIVAEPMFILLVVACSLYFFLGEIPEGLLMMAAMLFVAAISFYQDAKSTRALRALQAFTEPMVRVIREGKEISVASEELVPGDILLLEEGMHIPADAEILQCNDFTVNESIISGESFPVTKQAGDKDHLLYQGTTVNSGKCVALVTATGNQTVLGKLGKTVETYQAPKTLLQQQIGRFVRLLALFGLIAFLLIFLVNFYRQQDWAASLLFALTLAMSAVPEEIPVAFSSFMALGAYKMSRLGIITRQPQVVENLGAVSVICLDKTGTITENRMQVRWVYDQREKKLFPLHENVPAGVQDLLQYAVLASEKNPFDAMEKAIITACITGCGEASVPNLEMIYEYPLGGQPPMMTHVYRGNTGQVIVAAKGAAERIIQVCHLQENAVQEILQQVGELASKGYRVIAVAGAWHPGGEMPAVQDDFNWEFKGLLALYDPPREKIPAVIQGFYNAQIEVKLLTGDYPETAVTIATQAGIRKPGKFLTGNEVMQMGTGELQSALSQYNIFARMFPEAKLKVMEALKAKGEIVAMTGDGVNDGPALKASNIGIAMGKKGTEIARIAADLVLTDDDLEKVGTAIREGRKIFHNLKKAVRYIISIHIPIILTASLPVVAGWAYPNIFTPIHVIFLELIMGPTCSIFFEREPAELNLMEEKPRTRTSGLFTREEMLISVVQGLVIAFGVLYLYFYFMTHGASPETTRSIVFTTLVIANIFLTFVNRSFTRNLFYTVRYKNSLAPFVLLISAGFLLALQFIPFIRGLFLLAPLSTGQFGLCAAVALASVGWFEVYKTGLRHFSPGRN